MEIDEDDAPYLDLQDDHERQAYAMIKKSKLWSYQGLQIRTFSRKQVWTLTSLVFGMWLEALESKYHSYWGGCWSDMV